MKVDILLRPGCTAAKVNLQPGETFTAEGGSMIAMSSDTQIETTTHKKNSGGVMKAIKRFIAGESFFLNHYTASANGGEVFLAPTLLGDMQVFELNNSKLFVQAGSYLASEENINVDFSFQGMRGAFSGEGLFWLNINGTGKLIINSFGAIYPVEVDGEYLVDTGHIVAFEESLTFTMSKAGSSWISSILGGEGLVCKFKGKGRVWCQSHNPSSFGSTLGPLLKPRK